MGQAIYHQTGEPKNFATRHQAERDAKNFAQVPRQSKGGQPILASELNPTSRGQIYNTMVSYPSEMENHVQ